jgi:hypothetical protein
MSEKLPWLWLETDGNPDGQPEMIGKAACGCKLYRFYNGSGDPAFEMCPMHKAAPEMLKALREMSFDNPEVPNNPQAQVCICLTARLWRKIRKIVKKAS